jgi:F-type H+-transporting ATPase subunit delta
MAERTTVARPYADAAFEIAKDENALARWSEMVGLAEAIAVDPAMADALGSPKLDAAEKTTLFLSVAGDRFGPSMRNFVRVLIDADRIELLPEIRMLFEDMRNEAEGVAEARIETAMPITEAQLGELTAALAKRFGKRIQASTAVNPKLIGGARIAVGDTVIDGSVRGKLEAMRNALQT